MALRCRTRAFRPRGGPGRQSIFIAAALIFFLYELLQCVDIELRDLVFAGPAQWPAGRGAAACISSLSTAADEAANETVSSATSAPYLPVAELLCRPLASDLLSVPKLLHQSWKSTTLPAKFEQWSLTCREKHPDWEWVLWTDQGNLELVRRYFPWLEDTFVSLPGDIYRVDLARNLYMYLFGGVYLDLDTECLQPVSSALAAHDIPVSASSPFTTIRSSPPTQTNPRQLAVFGRMGNDSASPHSIPNAWMASTPGHPFFLLPLLSARREVRKSRSLLQRPWYDWPSAEQMTGPVALRDIILRYERAGRRPLGRQAERLASAGPFAPYRVGEMEHEVVLLDERWVYPFDWQTEEEGVRRVCSAEGDGFDTGSCKEMLRTGERGSVSITYWSHTHRGKGVDEENIERISRG